MNIQQKRHLVQYVRKLITQERNKGRNITRKIKYIHLHRVQQICFFLFFIGINLSVENAQTCIKLYTTFQMSITNDKYLEKLTIFFIIIFLFGINRTN